jgi:hypothetical protein
LFVGEAEEVGHGWVMDWRVVFENFEFQ